MPTACSLPRACGPPTVAEAPWPARRHGMRSLHAGWPASEHVNAHLPTWYANDGVGYIKERIAFLAFGKQWGWRQGHFTGTCKRLHAWWHTRFDPDMQEEWWTKWLARELLYQAYRHAACLPDKMDVDMSAKRKHDAADGQVPGKRLNFLQHGSSGGSTYDSPPQWTACSTSSPAYQAGTCARCTPS